MSISRRDHFEEFADHTLLKHLVLDKYVKQWGFKLLRGGVSNQVWFVDAFAGEGSDQKGNPGSPLIAASIAQVLAGEYPATPKGEAPMRVLAIELDERRGQRLKKAMEPFCSRRPPIAVVRLGTTLHDLLGSFLDYVKDTPTLFFLDPFGVDGLVVTDLPRLLRGPKNEVFALFADSGARRLYAALRAPDTDIEYQVQQVLDAPSFFDEMTAEDAERARREGERSNVARRSTQDAARRIFAEALGESWEQEIGKVNFDELPKKALDLWIKRLIDAGAAYVLSLPVRDSRNAHVYQLVYASKSFHGLRAMKDSIQGALNGSSLPADVIASIKSTFAVEPEMIVPRLQERFAGKRVRWTESGAEESIKRYLYEATPLLPDQFDAIRKALIARGWKERGQTIYFRFPS